MCCLSCWYWWTAPQKGVPIGMLATFDVHFDVVFLKFSLTCNHLNRDFRRKKTVLSDMEPDGTVLWSRDLETAAP